MGPWRGMSRSKSAGVELCGYKADCLPVYRAKTRGFQDSINEFAGVWLRRNAHTSPKVGLAMPSRIGPVSTARTFTAEEATTATPQVTRKTLRDKPDSSRLF